MKSGWLGSLIIGLVLITAFLVWNIWIICFICKDIKEGCYSGTGKVSPARKDVLIVLIALIPLIPALSSLFFRRRAGDILGSEVGGIYAVYVAIVLDMLLSKFITKLVTYTICCLKGRK